MNDNGGATLVVGPAWIGDMVMAQSLFMTLKQQQPEQALDVLAPAWSEPLLARMPQVRRAVPLPTGHGQLGLGQRRRLGIELRHADYRHAVVLPRSLKSALVPFFARVPRRTGYRGEWRYGLINDMRPLDKTKLRRTVERYVALGLPADAPQPPATPFPRLDTDPGNQQRLLRELGLNTGRPVVALLPGAEYGPAKRWPVSYFAELAVRLLDGDYQVWLLGSERDRAVSGEIASGAPGVVDLCGRTALVDAVDLLALCRGAVSNDSGLMHVAAAVNVPLIAMYGSSTPDYTPPMSQQARALYLGLECSPCFQRQCPKGDTPCLRGIGPEMVFEALQALLGDN